MSVTDDRYMKVVSAMVGDYTTYFRRLFGEQFDALHWGTQTVSDQEFVIWFREKAMANPNWVLALPYVEGGMRELARFERIMGIGREEVD